MADSEDSKNPDTVLIAHAVIYIVAGICLLGVNLPTKESFAVAATNTGLLFSVVVLTVGLLILPFRDFIARHKIIARSYSKFFAALVGIAILRGYIIEPTRISSNSMLPTLKVGDNILIYKCKYGITVPFSNKKWLIGEEPNRGELAVFHYPANPGQYFIKRLVGLPGDHISYHNNVLIINDQVVKKESAGIFDYHDKLTGRPGVERYREFLGEPSHDILDGPRSLHAKNAEWSVPKEHYFFLGDNRDDSNDSRFLGYVARQNLVGKPYILFSRSDS